MDTSNSAAVLNHTNGQEEAVHPNIARALTTGKYAPHNIKTWKRIQNIVSPRNGRAFFVPREEIASGSSGIVYKAKPLIGGRTIALKRMKLCYEYEGNPRILACDQEVHIMKLLCSDPSKKYKIPRYIDSYVVGDELWLVMEYIEGVNLYDATKYSYGLSPQEVATVFYHVLKAVEYMHSHGVMHNDIKWDNVMLGSNGEVKLIDLGLSTMITNCMRNANVSVGISAPELLRGEEYDSGTDIWAVGIMLYEVLFRQGPFCGERDDRKYKELMLAHGKPPIPRGWKIFPDFADFFDQCLTVNRHERPTATLLLRHEIFHGIKYKTTVSKTVVSRLVGNVTASMKYVADVLASSQDHSQATQSQEHDQEERPKCDAETETETQSSRGPNPEQQVHSGNPSSSDKTVTPGPPSNTSRIKEAFSGECERKRKDLASFPDDEHIVNPSKRIREVDDKS